VINTFGIFVKVPVCLPSIAGMKLSLCWGWVASSSTLSILSRLPLNEFGLSEWHSRKTGTCHLWGSGFESQLNPFCMWQSVTLQGSSFFLHYITNHPITWMNLGCQSATVEILALDTSEVLGSNPSRCLGTGPRRWPCTIFIADFHESHDPIFCFKSQKSRFFSQKCLIPDYVALDRWTTHREKQVGLCVDTWLLSQSLTGKSRACLKYAQLASS
jgi:hypothetical protein